MWHRNTLTATLGQSVFEMHFKPQLPPAPEPFVSLHIQRPRKQAHICTQAAPSLFPPAGIGAAKPLLALTDSSMGQRGELDSNGMM